MKVGDIVEIQPHVDLNVTNTIFTKTLVGLIKSKLNGDNYYDVLLQNGRVLFISGRKLRVLSESR